MTRLTFRSLSSVEVCLTTPAGDRPLLAFAGCSYLGLSAHPSVHAALTAALPRFGISASASRQTTGNTTIHEELEGALAVHMGLDSAILTPEGYTANLALAEALALRSPAALVDERSHRSVTHALEAAGIPFRSFAHGEVDAARASLEALRAAHPGRPVILATDGVFAADGSIAPLPGLTSLLRSEDVLFIDDCHGLGTLGPRGEGTLRHWAEGGGDGQGHFRVGGGSRVIGAALRAPGGSPEVCATTTLGKGLGCYGGAILGSTALISEVQSRSSLYRATTPVPPPLAAAALEALRLCREDPTLLSALRHNTIRLRRLLRDAGFCCPESPSPIAAFTLERAEAMESLHRALLAKGILAPLIDYPGGPAPRYFRLSVSAMHEEQHFQRLAAALSHDERRST
jgi:8-amino-7-oxononanoate synthase